MAASFQVLFDNGSHKCLSFSTLVSGEGVQANQFLVVNNGHAAVIDPGGDLTYTPLSIELAKHTRLQNLDYVIASHQDPDIIASLPRWLTHTKATIVASQLWARFLPHLASSFVTDRLENGFHSRLLELPDQGADIPLGDSVIKAIPAHFLHSVGNFQFYDPISKILFSGDMGASLVDNAALAVDDFAAHIPAMKGFHQRYMCNQKVATLWANMVRQIDTDMMVPQHGRPFKGQAMIHQFLDWISALECGTDLLTQDNFRCP
jgi:flavorubredoxin